MPLQNHTVVLSVVASVVLERDVDLMRIVFGAAAAILYQMNSASKNWGIGIVKVLQVKRQKPYPRVLLPGACTRFPDKGKVGSLLVVLRFQ